MGEETGASFFLLDCNIFAMSFFVADVPDIKPCLEKEFTIYSDPSGAIGIIALNALGCSIGFVALFPFNAPSASKQVRPTDFVLAYN